MSGLQASGRPAQFPYGFNNGVAIRGLPVLNTHAGNVVWVDSNFGNDGNPGTVGLPLATIAGAISALKNASGHGSGKRGDIIIAKPYHSETLTSATTYALQNVAIVGLSNGEGDTPTLILSSSTSATVKLGAPDMCLTGFKIVANVAATVCVTVASTGCCVEDTEIEDGSASFVTAISVVGGSANAADRTIIANNYINGASATQGILMNEVDSRIVVSSNTIFGSFSSSCITSTAALTNIAVTSNVLGNTNSTPTTVVSFSGSPTGVFMGNLGSGANASPVFTITGLLSAGNYIKGTAS